MYYKLGLQRQVLGAPNDLGRMQEISGQCPKISLKLACGIKFLAVYTYAPDCKIGSAKFCDPRLLDDVFLQLLHCIPTLEILYLVLDTSFRPDNPSTMAPRFVGGLTGMLSTDRDTTTSKTQHAEAMELQVEMLRAYQHASRIKSVLLGKLASRNRSATVWRPNGLAANDPPKPIFRIKIVQWSGGKET